MSGITVTIPGQKEITITHEDAIKYILDFLRNPPQHSYGDYGYDLHVHTMLSIYCKDRLGFDPYEEGTIFESLRTDASTLFMDACWELCRRGILRPFPRDIYGQDTGQGAGFSVTAFGKQWLQEAEFDIYVPTEPERFAELLVQRFVSSC
jgi:hypothetical protein